MLTNVYSDYYIRKSFYNCIKAVLHDVMIMEGPLQQDLMTKKFMDHQEEILQNIKEKDNRWHYPSLSRNLNYYFLVFCLFHQHKINISHPKMTRMVDYVDLSYEQLPSLDFNIFDIFLALCVNPFIISNLSTKDLLKLLVNFGTVASRFISCINILAVTAEYSKMAEKPKDHGVQIVNSFITSLYDNCDKDSIYHIKPAQENVNIDMKKSTEHFRLLNRYLNSFGEALDYTIFTFAVGQVVSDSTPPDTTKSITK